MYCFKWNYADNEPGVPLTEAEARAKHDAGEEFTAVMPPQRGTRSPVLVTPVWKSGVVAVTFLDDPGRKATEYTFMKRDDRLFLVGVDLWTYPTDEPGLRLSAATVYESISNHEDGTVKRIIKDKVKQEKETIEYTDVAMDSHWEPIPGFGDYESIARFERM